METNAAKRTYTRARGFKSYYVVWKLDRYKGEAMADARV